MGRAPTRRSLDEHDQCSVALEPEAGGIAGLELLEVDPVGARGREELDDRRPVRAGVDRVRAREPGSPRSSRGRAASRSSPTRNVTEPRTSTPICSFRCECSGTLTFGSSVKTDSVASSPCTDRPTTPSQILCGIDLPHIVECAHDPTLVGRRQRPTRRASDRSRRGPSATSNEGVRSVTNDPQEAAPTIAHAPRVRPLPTWLCRACPVVKRGCRKCNKRWTCLPEPLLGSDQFEARPGYGSGTDHPQAERAGVRRRSGARRSSARGTPRSRTATGRRRCRGRRASRCRRPPARGRGRGRRRP